MEPSHLTIAPSQDIADTFARRAGPFIVIVVAVFMLAWTWFQWPDPIVDFGRELYVPWQITQGKVLYRDLAYFNGPLSPYVNAVVFSILGVSLRSLVIVNILIAASVVVLIWRLWAEVADQLSALLAALLFVTVFACIQLSGIANYNFITPYSHELTHGIALSLAAILCVSQYQRGLQSSYLAGAGLLLGLIFLTKAEVFLAAAVAVGIGVILSQWAARVSPRRAAAGLGQFIFAALVAPMLALLLLWLALPFDQALRGTLGSWAYVVDSRITGMKFYERIFGWSDGPNNIHHILETAIWYAALLGPIAAIALGVRRNRMTGRGRAVVWLLSIVLTAAVLWSLQKWIRIDWRRAFLGLSLLMTVVVGGLAGMVLRANPQRPAPRRVMQLVVAAFALLLLGKMFLNVLLSHYGFALAMPATLVTVALLANWWPAFIHRRGGSPEVMRGAAIAVVGFIILIHLHFFTRLGSTKPTIVGSGADAFRADLHLYDARGELFDVDRRGTAVNLMLDALARLPQHATLAIVPEGTMINYLARRPNPTPYFNLMPPEVLMFGQTRILESFQVNPPDYIVLVLRSDPTSYGVRPFNEGYGREIYLWIESNYRQIPAPTEPTYPLVLLERK